MRRYIFKEIILPESQCKFIQPKSNPEIGFKKMFILSIAPVIVGSLISLFGFKFVVWAFNSDANFVYIDSGIQKVKLIKQDSESDEKEEVHEEHITIVLENSGDQAGVITSVRLDGDQVVEQFYASHTATDLKLRKKEYQKAEALVCPPKTYCEISFRATKVFRELEISSGKDFVELKI